MNETFLESMQRKGWVKAQDGSWSRPPTRREMKTLESAQQAALPKPAKRIRQSRDKMNKLEEEWFAIIKNRFPNYPPVRPHAKTFKLANGVRYTPDFTASIWPHVHGYAAKETAWEVKGPHSWDDAMVKVKVAASVWPEIQWLLVWKENGQWQEQEVLP